MECCVFADEKEHSVSSAGRIKINAQNPTEGEEQRTLRHQEDSITSHSIEGLRINHISFTEFKKR